MALTTAASVITPAGTACAFKQARRGSQAPRHSRLQVVAKATEEVRNSYDTHAFIFRGIA